jgi:hypothetical protein
MEERLQRSQGVKERLQRLRVMQEGLQRIRGVEESLLSPVSSWIQVQLGQQQLQRREGMWSHLQQHTTSSGSSSRRQHGRRRRQIRWALMGRGRTL